MRHRRRQRRQRPLEQERRPGDVHGLDHQGHDGRRGARVGHRPRLDVHDLRRRPRLGLADRRLHVERHADASPAPAGHARLLGQRRGTQRRHQRRRLRGRLRRPHEREGCRARHDAHPLCQPSRSLRRESLLERLGPRHPRALRPRELPLHRKHRAKDLGHAQHRRNSEDAQLH